MLLETLSIELTVMQPTLINPSKTVRPACSTDVPVRATVLNESNVAVLSPTVTCTSGFCLTNLGTNPDRNVI